ncbi:serine/threonine-protein kinase [Plantactinospora sp. B6F1]|uniref:serine/threonine-protein kinase n=1 Tax=Plantactinospora sp. B6F1 TaxID=3158971 RepID=UPI0032D8E23D
MFTSLTNDDPRQVGGYPLRARLGFGGMGQVYLSFTPGGRPVALKVVRPEYADDREFRRRFAEEVRAAQRVNGVYTAQLIDAADPEAEVPWLASAYVPGPTLHEAVREHGPLPSGTVRPLVAAVAMSLQAIHSAGVVHRDLAPRNVVLAADGPRVIDFGIARAIDSTHLTLSHTPLGTPSFMAPEQANGLSLTPAADVFSLGAVAYFAATGRTAFGDGNYLSVLRRVVEAEADLTGCPAELRALVVACLRKEPADRPSTAEVVEACGGTPRFATGWLPASVSTDIAARGAAVAAVAAGPPVTVPATSGVPPQAGPAAVPVPPRRLGRLAAFATVLVLLGVAGGIAINSFRDSGEPVGEQTGPASGASPTGGAAGTPTPTPPPGTPSPSTSPSPDPASEPQWSGTVRINGDGVDLDPVPPAITPHSGHQDELRLSAAGATTLRVASSEPGLATWTGGDVPTPAQCAELTSTQGVSSLSVAKDDVLCVATDDGRVALATIVSVTRNFTTGLTARVTVWPVPDGS